MEKNKSTSLKIKLLAVIGILGAALFAFTPPADNYMVSAEKSSLAWTGYHLGKSYEHTGKVMIKSGELGFSNGKLSGGSFVIDMTTITDEDLPEGGKRDKLVNHLKSDDFFNVGTYPEAQLVIKSAKEKGEGKYKIMSDLTIRGITKPLEFEADVIEGNEGWINAKASFRVERSQYQVMYGWSIENAVLDGEFKMDVDLHAKKSN